MKDVVEDDHAKTAAEMREVMAAYAEAEDLINLGAYARGSNPLIDRAIEMKPRIDAFLKQGIYERDTYDAIVEKLESMFRKKKEGAREGAARDYVSSTPYFARMRK